MQRTVCPSDSEDSTIRLPIKHICLVVVGDTRVLDRLPFVVDKHDLVSLLIVVVDGASSHRRDTVHLAPCQMTHERVAIQSTGRSGEMRSHC